MKQADIFLENRLVRTVRKETARTISNGSGVVKYTEEIASDCWTSDFRHGQHQVLFP